MSLRFTAPPPCSVADKRMVNAKKQFLAALEPRLCSYAFKELVVFRLAGQRNNTTWGSTGREHLSWASDTAAVVGIGARARTVVRVGARATTVRRAVVMARRRERARTAGRVRSARYPRWTHLQARQVVDRDRLVLR